MSCRQCHCELQLNYPLVCKEWDAKWHFNVILTKCWIICVSYKERFLAALPPSRRASTDFGRPVFTAAAFYLCAKRHKVIAAFINSLLCSCYRLFAFWSTESFPFFLVAQSWQTKANRSMWYIQHWVYNGNIVYSSMLCMCVHICTTRLCICAPLELCTVHILFSDFQFWLQVSTSMADLCFDVFGIAKEKKDPKSIKGNRGTYMLIHNSFVTLL